MICTLLVECLCNKFILSNTSTPDRFTFQRIFHFTVCRKLYIPVYILFKMKNVGTSESGIAKVRPGWPKPPQSFVRKAKTTYSIYNIHIAH